MKKNISSFRVIADHLRASSFLIAEGVLPSNEGRGYVLRRIMRRGMRHSHLLGTKDPVFFNIFKTLLEEMKVSYPELERAQSLIKETLRMEEEKFLVLLDRGIKILDDEISKIKNILPGEVAFKLYDTYGFPLDLTEDILKNKSLKVDHEKFKSLMKGSRELAKKNWKGSGDSAVDKIWFKIKDKLGATEFLGHETNQAEGVVLSLLKNNKEVQNLKSGDEAMLITNQTPFYAESGGQVGDAGSIFSGEFNFEVKDVQKKLGDLFIHYGKVLSGTIKVNDNVDMKIDFVRRNNIRAYHSATHLLHESLRRVLGTHVMQKGSLVEPERLRFDFSHMKPILPEEIKKIETYVNNMVNKKSDVKTRIMTPKEAVKNGALALFGEKYGDEVRVLSMGNERDKFFSTELCGGTHVRNTEDIGKFKIISQSSIAAGVRRIEALRDKQLKKYETSLNKEKDLKEITQKEQLDLIKKELANYKIKPDYHEDLELSVNIKNLNKQLEKEKVKDTIKDKTKNVIEDRKIGTFTLRKQVLKDYPPKELRNIIDQSKKDIKEGIVVGFSTFENKVGVAIGVTNKLTKKYDAVMLVKIASEVLGGKGGGGRNDFAQAGGIYKDKIDDAFDRLSKKIN